jgi:hypothetical protein
MGFDGSAGLLFTIRADAKNAEAELKRFVNSLSTQAHQAGQEFVQGFGPVGNALTALEGPAAIAVGAIGAIGLACVTAATAAVELGEKLFSMAESAAAVGKEFGGFEAKTGLSAQTVSALSYAANLAGKSINDLQRPLIFFTSNIEKAQQGSEKAADILKRLGVTDLTNLDHALDQAAAKVNGMAGGIDKMNLLADGFGKRGGLEMLTVLNKMPEGLEAFIEKAKELGVTLDEADIRAAKEFSHAMETLELQIKILSARFALQYAPQITKAIESISEFLAANQERAREWGESVTAIITGLIRVFNDLNAVSIAVTGSSAASWLTWSVKMISYLDPVQNAAIATVNALKLLGNADFKSRASLGGQDVVMRSDGTVGPAPKEGAAQGLRIPGISDGGGGRGGGGGGGKDNSAAEAEKAREAKVKALELEVRQELDVYKAGLKLRRAELDNELAQELISEKDHLRQVAELKIEELEREKAYDRSILDNKDINLSDKEKIELKQKIKVLTIEIKAETLKAETEMTEAQKKEAKALADILDKEQKRLQAIKDRRAEANKERHDKELEELKARTSSSTLEGGGFAGGIINGIQIMTDKTLSARDKQAAALNSIKQNWVSMGNVVKGVLDGMVNALEKTIETWVLTGETGPAVMRKILASALATIAAESAVRAIFELAKGFAALFFDPAEAASHFTSAALFGSIAAGSAIAGRAVAGDAFKQQTNSATGSSSNTQHTAGGATSYSSQEDTTVEQGRNTPGTLGTIKIQLGLDHNGVLALLGHSAQTNGKFRTLVLDTVASG